MRRNLRYTAQLAIVAAGYFGSAKAGLEFAFANESVTAVWAPTGLALAAVLIWGYRMWPAILAGAFLANITTAGPILAVCGIATGNTLEAVAGAYLLRRFTGFSISLDRASDVLGLVVYGAALSTMISATVGVASLSAAGLVEGGEVLSTWRVWWLGDAAGDLIVAPALLILASRPRLVGRPWIRTEAVMLFLALVGVSLIVFATSASLTYLIFPILLWIAFRYQQPGTVIAGLVVSGIAVWFTARGYGPFVGGSEDGQLLRAQTFVGVATITGLLLAALVTERQRAEKHLQRQADHDPLTGLVNRRRFAEELELWIAHSVRYGGRGAVLVIDVDNLKMVNDLAGHAAGDELLTRIAAVLTERLRDSDVVARLGGDEFCVLLPEADEEHAMTVAAALLERVHDQARVTSGDRAIPTTLSIGISSFGDGDAPTAEELLARADRAMYRTKAAGGSGVRAEDRAQPPIEPPITV